MLVCLLVFHWLSFSGPHTCGHAILPKDNPSFDLLAHHSLIAECLESKGAFVCTPLLFDSNKFLTKITHEAVYVNAF